MRMRWTLAAAACAAAGAAALAAEGGIRLATPVEVLAGGAPIDPEVGHATPNLVDWDGDGKRDLLVGQFGGGRLRVYLNSGTDADPKFRDFRFAKAGGKDASVPVA